jgi:hypothetical protein
MVASGLAEQADDDCILACISALESVRESCRLVLDAQGLIISEYIHCLGISGRPGPGEAFVKWANDVQADVAHCEKVHITVQPDESCYAEFPVDPALSGFDPCDRKFVAAAKASKLQPEVLNAVDPDWKEYHAALAANGVHVRFLCPQLVCPGR